MVYRGRHSDCTRLKPPIASINCPKRCVTKVCTWQQIAGRGDRRTRPGNCRNVTSLDDQIRDNHGLRREVLMMDEVEAD